MRKRGPNTRHHVATIVEHDIRRSKFSQDFIEKTQISLIPNTHCNLILFKVLAGFGDINPDNLCERSKIPFPQLQRSTFTTADLKENHRTVYVSRKMILVNREVMRPLVY